MGASNIRFLTKPVPLSAISAISKNSYKNYDKYHRGMPLPSGLNDDPLFLSPFLGASRICRFLILNFVYVLSIVGSCIFDHHQKILN